MRLPFLATLAALGSSLMGRGGAGKELPWEPPNDKGYIPRRRGRYSGGKRRGFNPFRRVSRSERRIADWTRSCHQANNIQQIRQASSKRIRPTYWQAAQMFRAILKAQAAPA